ncbi:MAG: HAMP domain-containing protein [Chloroflexi bacterium]|nr:HAMP domain-containing protein [Chloroflexota bacterium]
MLPHLSLRRKLILATVGAGLIPLLLGLAIAYWSAQETLRVTIGRDFQELAKATARHVDLIIEREVLEANNLALEPLVRSAVLEADHAYDALSDEQVQSLLAKWTEQPNSSSPANNRALSKRLQAYQGLGGEYFQIMLTDKYGVSLASLQPPQTYVQSSTTWWQRAMKGNLYIGDVSRSTKGEDVLLLAVPIRGDDGTPIGVLQMTHYVDDLFLPINELHLGRTGHANLIDSSGTLIVEPGDPSSSLRVKQTLLETVASNHVGWVVAKEEHHQARAIIAYAPVKTTMRGNGNFGNKQWYVFIRQDASEAFAPSNSLLVKELGLGVTLVLLLSMLGTLLAREVLEPLQRLHTWARGVGQGNLSQRLNLSTGDEIQDLAETFNEMADQLQALYQGLEEKVTERTKELATLNAVVLTSVQSLGLEDVLNTVLDQVTHTLGMADAWILLPRTPGGTELHVVANHGNLAPPCDTTVGDGDGRCRCEEIFAGGEGSAIVTAENCPWLQQTGRSKHACIPLRAKGRTVGILNVAQDEVMGDAPPLDSLIPLLTTVGRQIGVVVENAILYEELQRKEALRSHLLQRVITAQEEERKRVARELHDGFAQTLTALIMSLEAAEAVLPPGLTAERQHLGRTKELCLQTLQETRQLIVELRPSVLDDLGLVPAIRWYAGWLLAPQSIQTQLRVHGQTYRFPAEIETALFRIAQESLSNVAKHASATHIEIELRYAPTQVTFQLEDDGVGFEAAEMMNPDDLTRGLGLKGIRERVSLFGGTLDISSRQGEGTRILVTLPAQHV